MSSISSPIDKPQNGVPGLKYWKSDLMAGLMVSLTSLPFSLGIAVASGAPPIAGLTSAIIAGLIFPFLGGSYLTISGPAAGLAPALFAAMTALGHGNREIGYPLLLAVICMVGVIQIGLGLAGAGRLNALFPVAVVEGMLAAIGLLIIAKEMPHFLGRPFEAHSFFGYLAELPVKARTLDPKVFGVGMTCLALMFLLHLNGIRKRLPIPPPLVVVVVGVILGQVLGLGADQAKDGYQRLIEIPDQILKHGIVPPNFTGLFADRSLLWAMVSSLLVLMLIDSVESLATIKAIDKIDPYKRKSNPDRTLMAMGVSKICSSLAGGLTIIPGGVKSKLCINSGGKTLWANFYNAIFLILFLFVAKDAIKLIPYSALAAILIFTGYKMCELQIWRHIAHIGFEQLVVFTFTILVTLWEDLLVGIAAGMALKLLINVFLTSRHVWSRHGRPLSFGDVLPYAVRHLSQLFRNPVVTRHMDQGTYHMHLERPLVCFNSVQLTRELDQVPAEANEVLMHVGEGVAMIDHTSCDMLLHFAEEFEHGGRGRVEIVGMDRMESRSKSPAGMRVAPTRAPAVAPEPEPHPLAVADAVPTTEPLEAEERGEVQVLDI